LESVISGYLYYLCTNRLGYAVGRDDIISNMGFIIFFILFLLVCAIYEAARDEGHIK